MTPPDDSKTRSPRSSTGPDEALLEGHGGRLAAAALRASGVEHLFTLSGGHLFSLYDGCVQEKIDLVDVRHEQSAVFAAEGYAKVSRRPGVAGLTAGPGVTNGTSAITSAHFTGSPVFVIGGRAPAGRWGQGSLQELDHVPLVAPVTRWAATSSSTEGIAADMLEGVARSQTAHRGPTFLDVPMDLFFGPAAITPPEAAGVPERTPDEDALTQVASLLDRAQKPVLMAGADVYWDGAEQALAECAQAAGLPVFVNGLARGCLPADHELFFARCRKAAFSQSDLVLVIGTPLDFRLGFGRFGDAQVVHAMDVPERISTHVDLAGSVAGDLRLVLAGLADRVERPGSRSAWLDELRREESALAETEREMLEADGDPIHPGRIYGELVQRLERDAVVVGDGGDFVSYAGKLVPTYEPGCFLDPGPFGCLGTGPGYALGACTAFPERQVVLLSGDGAAGFALGDWDTLIRFDCNVTIVVGNNHCWGLEKHPMQQFFGYHVAAELSPEARYDRVFEALGGQAELVEKPGELGGALERALAHRGPSLVNVLTDPENVYPRSSNLG